MISMSQDTRWLSMLQDLKLCGVMMTQFTTTRIYNDHASDMQDAKAVIYARE